MGICFNGSASRKVWHIVVRVAAVKVCRVRLTSRVAGRRGMGICFRGSASQGIHVHCFLHCISVGLCLRFVFKLVSS